MELLACYNLSIKSLLLYSIGAGIESFLIDIHQIDYSLLEYGIGIRLSAACVCIDNSLLRIVILALVGEHLAQCIPIECRIL